MKHAFSLIALVAAFPALAEGVRELDAHEHGVGTLNIAIDGATVAMSFEAPGADIVGFEYGAQSSTDLAAIDAAVAILGGPLDLFVMPDAASCSVVDAHAALEGDEDHGHDDHGDEDHDDHGHDDHGDGGHDDHRHDDHGDEGHDDHGHDDHGDKGHDDHGHDDHADKADHTEFHAQYTLSCDSPDALSEITFAYFDVFPNAKEVDVQIITALGAQAFEVTRDAPVLDLGR
jgi:hypothetical protein